MPSKIPQEAEIDSDDGEEMMPMGAGYPGMPERKEYLWSCDLKGKRLSDGVGLVLGINFRPTEFVKTLNLTELQGKTILRLNRLN